MVAQALMDIRDTTNNLDAYRQVFAASEREVAQHQQNFAKISARYKVGYADLYSDYEAVDILSTPCWNWEAIGSILWQILLCYLKRLAANCGTPA